MSCIGQGFRSNINVISEHIIENPYKPKPKLLFRVHAVQRMFERNVPLKKVLGAIESGETIEDYSAEMPDPGRLILVFQGKRPVHVVCSENLPANETTIITVYVPDPDKWNEDFKHRRS